MRYGGASTGALGGAYGGVTPVAALKIVTMGASESAKNGIMDYTWPKRLEHLLQSATSSREVVVRSLAISGSTFFRANTFLEYGSNTMVQEAIVARPDVIICMFGGNDLMNVADGRTLAQVKTDADTFFSTLRAALPGCLMIYCYEKTQDLVNFTSANCKNKGITTQFMELPAAGILSGSYTGEMLDTVVSGATQTKLQNMIDLDSYIATGPSTAFNIVGVNKIVMDFWKLQRMGVTLPDMAHHNAGGHQLMAAWVYKQLKANAAFALLVPRMSTQIINSWQDPDQFFSYYLTASGDGFVRAAGAGVAGLNGEDVARFWGDQMMFSPEEFHFPFKSRLSLWPANLTITNTAEWPGTFRIILKNGPPTQLMYLSIAGAAFVSSGESTDNHGNFETTVNIANFFLTNGTYVFRFKCGTEVYGPYSIIVNAPLQQSQVSTDATAGALTIAAAKVAGAREVIVNLTALGSAQNLTLPTFANLTAAIPGVFSGQSYKLRIINSTAAGAFAWTLTDNGTCTVVGTRTINQNTWRDFQVSLNAALTAAVFTSVGTGTYS